MYPEVLAKCESYKVRGRGQFLHLSEFRGTSSQIDRMRAGEGAVSLSHDEKVI